MNKITVIIIVKFVECHTLSYKGFSFLWMWLQSIGWKDSSPKWPIMCQVKGKECRNTPMERRRGAHLPFPGGYTTEFVTRGQYDARPTVTFPATEHHRPLAGINLYSLVDRGTCVWTTCPRSFVKWSNQDSNLRPVGCKAYALTNMPRVRWDV